MKNGEGQGANAVISAQRVTYSYEQSVMRALSEMSADIKPGEFLCVIGHNGSGKSTFAKLLNALLLPTSGKVYVGGMDTADEGKTYDIRRMCGMVFQNPDNQLVASVVEDDVAFGPENLGLDREEIRRRVDNALAAVGMSEFLHRTPSMLSGGQKQRIALAGVLALMPDVVVLDEPTAMLDPAGRREVMEVIVRLNRELNKTIVLVTHYMEEAVYAHRVIVMKEGAVIMEGTPKAVFARSKELRKARMGVPIATQVYESLASEFDLGDVALTGEELAEKLCPLLQKT